MSELPEWMQKLIPDLSREFDQRCVQVHESEEDSEKWLSEDTMEQALNDLAYMANNARYTFMRVRLLQERLKRHEPEATSEDFRKDTE